MKTARPRATRLLDLGDPAEIERFERAFYAGFSLATHNRLVRWLWDWDDGAQRLRTRLPYAEQKIWGLTGADGALTGAIAVNTALRSLQGAAYGFAVPAGLEAGRVCEFLTLFVVSNFSLANKHALWTELYADLRAAGFTHAVATTSPKILPLYRWAGAEVIAEATLEGEVRYFLLFDLARTPGVRRRRAPVAGEAAGSPPASFRLPAARAGVGISGVNQPQPIHIRSIEVAPLDIPLFEPFGISGGAQAAANNVLVTLELADGTKGYGEAAPLPAYNGETQAQAIKTLTGAQLWLAGYTAPDWRRAAAEFRGRGGAWCGSAQCAFEMALLDALTKQRGEPLWKFFGGAGTGLETDMTVTTGTAAEAADATRAILRRGIRMVKVKVGGKAGPAHDLERVAAIHGVAPDSPLILDGNAGVSRAAASELVRGLKARGIRPALLEQWLAKDDL
ncbi:MAG: hypothetical protein NTV51_02400, partial [Verrucomicrobia bacterium]|nr:hypothetical protein [Verrucomicrobiota bacterium]